MGNLTNLDKRKIPEAKFVAWSNRTKKNRHEIRHSKIEIHDDFFRDYMPCPSIRDTCLKDFPLFVRYGIHLQRYRRIALCAHLERKSVRSVPMPQKSIGDYILDSAIPFALKKAVYSLSVLDFVRVELYKPRRMALPCAPGGWAIRKQVLSIIGLRNPLKPLLP